jgi:hypothetical protein
MTSENLDSIQNTRLKYADAVLQRATRAVRCSPLTLTLLLTMQTQGVALQDIAGNSGVQLGYTPKVLSEREADRSLGWLIQVGLLRREVDGQGLTDSFRLTPLGRQLVDLWQEQGISLSRPSVGDRLQESP